jgi:hypothetical protein
VDLVAILVGGIVLGVLLTLGILRSRKTSSPTLPEEEPESDEAPRDVYEVALGAAEPQGEVVTRRGNAIIFGLPPQAQERKKNEVVVEAELQEDKVVVDSHPCVHLSGETPPNYKPSECSGICKAPGQRGRPCFWASNAASMCPYFRPRVLPTRVKLKKVG